jgi:hypothetical protein
LFSFFFAIFSFPGQNDHRKFFYTHKYIHNDPKTLLNPIESHLGLPPKIRNLEFSKNLKKPEKKQTQKTVTRFPRQKKKIDHISPKKKKKKISVKTKKNFFFFPKKKVITGGPEAGGPTTRWSGSRRVVGPVHPSIRPYQ